MRRVTFTLVVILAAACASSSRPADVEKPDISVHPEGTIFFGSSSTAPVTLLVDITNHGKSPLTVRQVEISSPSMATWGIRTVRRFFNETVPPGETRTLTLFATGVTSVMDPGEPLTLRANVIMEVGGKSFREIVTN
jgi:hypothetical protein